MGSIILMIILLAMFTGSVYTALTTNDSKAFVVFGLLSLVIIVFMGVVFQLNGGTLL